MKDCAAQPTASSAQILLVDDNRLGLVARKSVLEELGYQISTAAEGQAALELYRGRKFDLVITDYKMPRMNGLELIQRIREIGTDTPIILISGYADALGMNEENTGADAVISKSANEVVQLVRCVNRLLRRATPRKPPARQKTQVKTKRQSAH
jgi:CheY-like chemotaxis protein